MTESPHPSQARVAEAVGDRGRALVAVTFPMNFFSACCVLRQQSGSLAPGAGRRAGAFAGTGQDRSGWLRGLPVPCQQSRLGGPGGLAPFDLLERECFMTIICE